MINAWLELGFILKYIIFHKNIIHFMKVFFTIHKMALKGKTRVDT